MAESWRRALFVVVAALAATARAGDPPPAKPKPSRVSPRAQAAIDKYRDLVYDAAEHGLVSMTSTLVPVGLPSHARPRCKFAAPGEFSVNVPRALEDDLRRANVSLEVAKAPLTNAYFEEGMFEWDDSSIDLVEKDGVSVIVLRSPADGDVKETHEYALDADGLVTRQTRLGAPGSGVSGCTIRYSWGTVGDENCIVAFDASLDDAEPHSYSCTLRYADVRGIHLPVSYDVSYVAGNAAAKKFSFHVDDLVVNGEKVDLPRPWKHVNVVSPEAKDAIDKFKKLVYRPEEHGLESVTSVLVPIGFASRGRGYLTVKSPATKRASLSDAVESELRDAGIWRWPFSNALFAAYDAADVVVYEEFDATAVAKDDGLVVTFTEYSDGEPWGSSAFSLDAEGLVRKQTHRAAAESGRREFTVEYAWASFGGQKCVVGFDIAVAGAKPERYACRLNYADVAGFHLLASFEMRYTAKDAETKTFTIYVDDLEVNGAKIALPKPWVHVNLVSPEAQAAIDAYERLAYRPLAHGLSTVTAILVADGAAPPALWRFDVEKPHRAAVSAAAGAKPTAVQRNVANFQLELPLRSVYDAMPVAYSPEHDAEFVDRDGRRVLVVTNYRDGAKLRTDEFTFDAAGMISSVATGRESAALRLGFAWEKAGDQFRVSQIEVSMGDGAKSFRIKASFTYSDVAGLRLATSFTTSFTAVENGKTAERTATIRLASLVVDGKKVDVADPTAHANVVTPEAQAALDAFAKLVYRASDHGFRSASGTLAPGGIRFEVTPQGAVVRPPEMDPGGTWANVGRGVKPTLGFAYNGPTLVDSPQYDAEFVEEQGRRVLVVTTYQRGTAAAKSESVLDDRGLLVSMRATVFGETPSKSEMRLAWAAIGGQWQIERMECWDVSKPAHVTVALAFAEISGVRVPVSFKWMISNVQGKTTPMTFATTDFVMNGEKIDVPKIALHENVVTPEAQTLMDAYARIVDRPTARGLVTASGDVAPEGEKPARRRFSFTAPLFLAVTPPPAVKPESPDGQAIVASTRLALLLAIDGLRLAESLEYDARVVERDGGKLLEVVEFHAGARSALSEFTFDADGLVATLRRRDGADPAAPTSDVTFRLEWEKTDGLHRVRAAELTVGLTRKRYEIGRARFDGVDFVTSYSVVVVENGKTATYRYRVEDLALNGKKIDVPKPDWPTSDGRK